MPLRTGETCGVPRTPGRYAADRKGACRVKDRLDRRLSSAAGLTRSRARSAIRAGTVTVDGLCLRDPAAQIAAESRIALNGERLPDAGPRYYMLHKPGGFSCTTGDDAHPGALVLLDVPGRERLHFAGRLDADATGLVLVTDDGDWSHRITSPRRGCMKTYCVRLSEPLADDARFALEHGVALRGESRPAAPALVESLGEREIRLTLGEGRYHQVKRMIAAVGNHVLTLHRERIGAIALDPALAPGEWRALTPEEIASIRA